MQKRMVIVSKLQCLSGEWKKDNDLVFPSLLHQMILVVKLSLVLLSLLYIGRMDYVIVVVLDVVGVVMRQSANRPFWYAWMALFSDVAAAEHPVAS